MKNETDNPESRWWIGCVTRSTFQTNSSSRVVVGIASRIGPSVRHWKHRYPDVRLYFNEEDQKDDYVGVQPKSRSIKIERIELARQRERKRVSEGKREKERGTQLKDVRRTVLVFTEEKSGSTFEKIPFISLSRSTAIKARLLKVIFRHSRRWLVSPILRADIPSLVFPFCSSSNWLDAAS